MPNPSRAPRSSSRNRLTSIGSRASTATSRARRSRRADPVPSASTPTGASPVRNAICGARASTAAGAPFMSTKAAATLDGIRNGSVDFASVADVVAAVQPGAGAPSGYGTAQLTRGKYLIASPIGDPPAFTGTVATELTVR
ncbi:MAG: hypothetical protein J0I49_02750 [Pseudonocardia sp.]|uniref:hypothetical protein n=1 Tax=Pseudonocardia sp. TaxID=60912 RepID=UPI001AC77AA5|nr:hypothetical protein [Pseudonocardia sp.]MBN9097022.1 hypothetical protein [Pseudonocardia sp.]